MFTWSIAKRLWLLVALELVAIAAIFLVSLVQSKTAFMEERQRGVRNVVEAAHGILTSYATASAEGKLSTEQAQQQAAQAIGKLRYSGQEYFWINDMHPRMVMHPFKPELNGTDLTDNKDPDGTRLFVAFVDTVKRDGGGFVFYRWPKPGAAQPVAKISYVKGFAPWSWIIGSGVYLDDVDAAFWRYSLTLGLLTVVIAAVIMGLTVFVSRRITRPLTDTADTFSSLARELGEGRGDLTRHLTVSGRDELSQMGESFNTFMEKLREVMGQVKQAATSATTASQELSAATERLSAGAQEQASSLEETAASLEEITGTVKQNADNARQANQLATGSRETAEKGGEVVTAAVSAMREITQSSKKIADIITTIDEIAFQTNLLALNAAVEAARAGEQGRGFAVVAAEVRNLAQRSATAAKEIKGLIEDSVAKVDTGSQLVNRAGETLTEIVMAVKRVTDIIAEIAAASAEQSTGIDQVNRAVTQMDEVVQSNAAQTEELSSTAQRLTAQSEELQGLVGRFRLGDAVAATARPAAVARTARPATGVTRVAVAKPRRPEPALHGNGHGGPDGFDEF